MARKLGACVVAVLAAASMGQQADGRARHVRHPAFETRCAKPQEMTAIQVAAVQQELMVAALTCQAVPDFNAFQTTFHEDLQTSDHRLYEMFRRIFGRKGEADYHAFKTRLANNDSIRAIHDPSGYCHEAQQFFTAAEAPSHPGLSDFVASVRIEQDGPVDSCDMKVNNSIGAPPLVSAPTPNPLRTADTVPDPASSAPSPTGANPGPKNR